MSSKKCYYLPSYVAAAAWSLVAVSESARSSDDYLDLSIEQLLSAKVVSASKKLETVADAAVAISVVSNEDIQRSGVTTIADALRMVPGVQVARSDSNSWAISIRGFNSTLANKLLVLIDGRTIYNPVFGGVLWEAYDLLLEDIERIEVIRGPGGTLWGANAVNGVINIITKKAQDTQDNLATVIYGNEETGTLSARHGGKLGDAGAYRAYVRAFQRDSSQKPTDENTYDEWDGFRTGFRADWDNRFTLQGDAYQTKAQQLRPHHSLVVPFTVIEQQTIKYEGAHVQGRWTDIREDGSQWSIQSYIDWAKRDEPFNFIDDRMTYDLDMQYNWVPLKSHEIITGAGYRFLTDDEVGDNNTSFSPQQRRNNLYSIFIQDKITLAPQSWFLTLGSKFEHNDFSGLEIQPNIRTQWHITNDQSIWAAVSHAVRTPTPIEEDLTSTLATANGVRVAFVPNNHFKSEELIAYEVGYRNQLTDTSSLDVATFYNDYENLTTTSIQAPLLVNNGVDPIHFLIPVMFTNNMKGKTSGFEAAFNWLPSSNVKVASQYTYLHMSLDALDPEQEGAEKIYPKHQAGINIFWNINNHWTLDTSVHYVDKIAAFELDAYVGLNVNLGRKLSENLYFNLVGQNITDPSHREFGSPADINMGEIERSIYGKLKWQF